MSRPSVICVGASAGGVAALQTLLTGIHEPLAIPMLITQHLPAHAELDLELVFGRASRGKVVEALDKMPMENGKVYFAPPGYHMQVEREGYLSLNQDEPVLFSRPSIDVLFESAAWAFGDRVCGVLLTGANADGAAGLKAIAEAHGTTIVQDPKEAEASAMPLAAIQLFEPDYVLTLDKISDLLSKLSGQGGL